MLLFSCCSLMSCLRKRLSSLVAAASGLWLLLACVVRRYALGAAR